MTMITKILNYSTSVMLLLLAVACFFVDFPDMERNFWNIGTPLCLSLAATFFIYQWHREEKNESIND